MLHQELKEATRKDHDEMECMMYVNDILSGNLTINQYRHVLTTNYRVHKALEDAIFRAIGAQTALLLHVAQRSKLPALEADMCELGLTLPEVPVYTGGNILKNEAAALGAMYVLEGATLGGNVIVKRLRYNTHLPQPLSFNYYQLYGDNLIPNWKHFCSVLDLQPENTWPDSISGAKAMFGYIACVHKES